MTKQFNLSEEQKLTFNGVIDKIKDGSIRYNWYCWPPSIIKIAGYAGTGKTFLLSAIRKELQHLWPGLRVAMVTFTGKASSVLAEKVKQNNAFFYGDYIGTIHKLIYIPITKYDSNLKRRIIVGWEKKHKENLDCEIIIIDEASMVSEPILKDLQSYQRPIIAFGDNGQLPPVGERTTILSNPDFQLKEIHRQALNSPIINLANYVRKGGRIPSGVMFSNDVFKLSWFDKHCQTIFNNIKIDKDVIFLCGFNKSRVLLNQLIRQRLGWTLPEPAPTERVICLQNNHQTKLMNGQISTVIWYMPEADGCYRLTLENDGFDEPIETYVHPYCFGKSNYDLYDSGFFGRKLHKTCLGNARDAGFDSIDFFDYGYACSVHKSQGSEWNRVILFEQRTSHWDEDYYNKWLYTAITRAKKKLFIIQDFY